MSTEPPRIPRGADPIEKQIEEAIERGEFDSLPGAGKPIEDLDQHYDPAWWARRYVERARSEDAADDLRRLIRNELPRLKASADREAAERRVAEINAAIDEVNTRLAEPDRLPSISL